MDDKEATQQTEPMVSPVVTEPAGPEHAVAEQAVTEPAAAEAGAAQAAAESEDAAHAPPQVFPLPGELLAARRQELRLSIDEVCARVKLAPRQIYALEANDFAALPGMATVRGFVRSYAKVLGLAPEPLLAGLAGEASPLLASAVVRRPLPSPVFSGRRYAPPTSHRRSARRLTGMAIALCAFVGTLAFFFYQDERWQQLSFHDMVAVAAPALPGKAGAPVALPAPPALPEPAAAPATVEAAAQVTSASVVPASALQLAAREDAWVELIAIDGERKLVSKLMKAGSTELIEIVEPVILVVGNAAGIEAVLRGQSLNLRAVARDNVAKLSLK